MAEPAEKFSVLATALVDLTADIVSVYVSNNIIASGGLPDLIENVYAALSSLESEKEELIPAVLIKKSISGNFLICLEDEKEFKSLKRNLRTHYDLTPEEYRAKWGLSSDYPMIAPNYTAARSKLAKTMGLGQKRMKRGEACFRGSPRRAASGLVRSCPLWDKPALADLSLSNRAPSGTWIADDSCEVARMGDVRSEGHANIFVSPSCMTG